MARYIEAVKAAEVISEKLNIPLGDLVDIFAEIPTTNGDKIPPCEVGDYVRIKGYEPLLEVEAIHYYLNGFPKITATDGRMTVTFPTFETFEVFTKEEVKRRGNNL